MNSKARGTIRLTVDGREVAVRRGATLLEACAAAGADVPLLCRPDGAEADGACMVCAVQDPATGRFLPACSAQAAEGMAVETAGPDVEGFRRAALELLLAEHVGDCEAPCTRACPSHVDIPLLIRSILAGRPDAAVAAIKDRVALPATLGRNCPAPCERSCRRAGHDGPLAICLLKLAIAEADLASRDPYLPPKAAATGRSVAVVGAGPCGLTAAYFLLRAGHACAVFDDRPLPGGRLRYGGLSVPVDPSFLDAEIDVIRRLGAAFSPSLSLGRDVSLESLLSGHDAVLLAVGAVPPEGRLAGVLARSGLSLTGHGIAADASTFATEVKGVFAGGSALRAGRLAATSSANGPAAAVSIDRHLAGRPLLKDGHRFSSTMGRVAPEEMAAFLSWASPEPPVRPSRGDGAGLSGEEAAREAARCLHCDCRRKDSCRLRELSERHGAVQRRYRPAARDAFCQDRTHGRIVFEPGKCVKCGRCVRISAREKEPLGMAILGRGGRVTVRPPLGASLADALTTSADRCVEACPTGALSRGEGPG